MKATINPGVCGFVAKVEAEDLGDYMVKVKVETGCESITKMFAELGDTFSAFDAVTVKPGSGPLYEFASKHFVAHGCCPTIACITKVMEATCGLALPRPVSLTFDEV